MSKRRTRESRYATRSMQKAQTTLGPAKKNIEVAEQAIDEYLKQYKKTSDLIPAKKDQAMNVSKWEDVRAKKNSPEKLKEINERVEHLIEKYEDGFDKLVRDVTSILEGSGHGIYIIGDLAHGKRITTNTRLKVCVYNSGKIVVQGNPEKKDEVVLKFGCKTQQEDFLTWFKDEGERQMREKVYFFEPLEKEISVEDMQKIVDANEKLVKELKDGNK